MTDTHQGTLHPPLGPFSKAKRDGRSRWFVGSSSKSTEIGSSKSMLSRSFFRLSWACQYRRSDKGGGVASKSCKTGKDTSFG